MQVLAILLGLAAPALPPPMCKGRIVGQYDAAFDRNPKARAVAEVQAAYDALCPKHDCGTGQLFENETMGNNAATWVSGLDHGQKTRAKIVYSARFLNELSERFGPGASFGVLAHEVGHHLTAALSMRSRFESSWNEELRADYLAGCALGKTGRTSAEMENALRALAAQATASHPSFQQRVPVVRKGFEDCRAQGDLKTEKAFGLGNAVRKAKDKGCWRYTYRLNEQVQRLGPVVAPRRKSRGYASEDECGEARQKWVDGGNRLADACTCEE